MHLKISRKPDGTVLVTDTRTGRTEMLHTDVLDRPVEVRIAEAASLPAHQWSRVDAVA